MMASNTTLASNINNTQYYSTNINGNTTTTTKHLTVTTSYTKSTTTFNLPDAETSSSFSMKKYKNAVIVLATFIVLLIIALLILSYILYKTKKLLSSNQQQPLKAAIELAQPKHLFNGGTNGKIQSNNRSITLQTPAKDESMLSTSVSNNCYILSRDVEKNLLSRDIEYESPRTVQKQMSHQANASTNDVVIEEVVYENNRSEDRCYANLGPRTS